MENRFLEQTSEQERGGDEQSAWGPPHQGEVTHVPAQALNSGGQQKLQQQLQQQLQKQLQLLKQELQQQLQQQLQRRLQQQLRHQLHRR